MSLSNRTAYVTGASQGIGRDIALELAAAGANVALVARREDRLEDTAADIDAPERTLISQTDVTIEEAVDASVDETVSKFGGIDILVNNAGIPGPRKPIESITFEDFRQTLTVNVGGMFLTTKHIVPHLRASDCGRIINIASITAKQPLPNLTPYNSSKMAVIGLTRTLALELGDDGVTVNAICPGPTAGPRIEASIQSQANEMGLSYEEAKERYFVGDSAQGVLLDGRDIAALSLFLASDKAAHITGQDINVDGGECFS